MNLLLIKLSVNIFNKIENMRKIAHNSQYREVSLPINHDKIQIPINWGVKSPEISVVGFFVNSFFYILFK